MEIPDAIREQVLKNVIDSAPFPMGVYVGYNMKIVLANKCMIKTYGKGPNVIGLNYTDILPELENQKIFDQLRAVLATGEPFETKNARVDITIDGLLTPHYFNYNFTPIFNQDGTIYGVMNTAAEVTELNLSKQHTLEAEQQLRHAVEAAEIGTFEKNLETGHVTGSKRFYEILGIQPDNTDEETLIALLQPEDLAVREAAYARLALTRHLDYEAAVQVSGRQKFVRIKASVMHKEGSRLLIGVIQDITEQKIFAQKLHSMVQEQTEQLKRSNDDLKQLGHVLSHDLKEPVRKIVMFSKLIEENWDGASRSKLKLYVEKIKLCAERVFSMVDDILKYATVEGGNERFEPVDINEVFHGILDDFEITIRDKDAHITATDLPVIWGSKTLLRQLFENLLSNSLKFSRPGITPVIVVKKEIAENYIQILFLDNGIGIEEKYLEEIFTTFKRLNPKDKFEGTGLGLSLCRKIVERHKGKITAMASDNGAMFKIIFPV